MTDIEKQLIELNEISNKSVALYHKVALYMGISDSALGILCALLEKGQQYSQYDLIGKLYLPKQTINTTISLLQKKGLVTLSQISNLRNKKFVMLTEQGKKFVDEKITVLRNAEICAISNLSAEERDLYIRLNQKYNKSLTEKLE